MVITDLAVSQAIGGSAADNLLPTKTTLNAATSALSITWQLTLGGIAPPRSSLPRLYYVVSPFSVAAADARATFLPQAEFTEMLTNVFPTSSTVGTTELIVNTGLYCYTWIDTQAFGAAGSINIKLVELN
jgi:hypothetical protein